MEGIGINIKIMINVSSKSNINNFIKKRLVNRNRENSR